MFSQAQSNVDGVESQITIREFKLPYLKRLQSKPWKAWSVWQTWFGSVRCWIAAFPVRLVLLLFSFVGEIALLQPEEGRFNCLKRRFWGLF